MEKNNSFRLGTFFRVANPLQLILGAILYALGVGVVVFRGETVHWAAYWLGQAGITLLQLTSAFLKATFDQPGNPDSQGVTSNTSQKVPLKNALLLTAVTMLTIGAMVTVLLFANHLLSASVTMVLGLILILIFIYSIPPFRLVDSGYGELIEGLFLIILVPVFGYLLQAREIFNSLGLLTFPILALFLAMKLAFELETYYADVKTSHQNMMVRLGWQRGMFLHNLLILVGFISVGAGMLVGFPWSLTWPRLLTLPVGLFQVWQMWVISNGAPTRWKLLRLTAVATLGISLYLTLFMLWAG